VSLSAERYEPTDDHDPDAGENYEEVDTGGGGGGVTSNSHEDYNEDNDQYNGENQEMYDGAAIVFEL
jgi:hypothetical protein